MLQAAAAAVLLLASKAWHSHGVLELLAAGAWWRHPAKQPSQCPWTGHAKHSQGKLFTVTTFYTNNIQRSGARVLAHCCQPTPATFQKTICTNVNVRSPTLHPALIPLIWSPPFNLIAILKHLQRTSTTPLHTPVIMLTLQWSW